MVVSLLFGCGEHVDGELIQPRWIPQPEESRCRPDMEPCIDLAMVPVSWRAEGAWQFNGIYDLGDVTGDGVGDATAVLWDTDGSHGSIVFGPLDRDLQLPSGEDLGFDEVPWPLDITGDGMNDLIVKAESDPAGSWQRTILAAPVSSATRVDDALGTFGGTRGGWWVPRDVDGDGVLDYVLAEDQRIEVVRGAWYEWENEPPDLTLRVPCTPSRYAGLELQMWPAPDLDLDGAAELWVAGGGPDPSSSDSYNDCEYFRVPANATGKIDVPATYPPAPLLPPRSYGDQDGDGVVEVGWNDLLLSLPVFTVGDQWEGTVIGSIAEVYGAYPLPLGIDVVGDRYPDLVQGFEIDGDHATAYIAGGPDGGISTGEVALHVLWVPEGSTSASTPPRRTYVFDGYAVSVEPSVVRIHPLD